jgi:hypothetical protein
MGGRNEDQVFSRLATSLTTRRSADGGGRPWAAQMALVRALPANSEANSAAPIADSLRFGIEIARQVLRYQGPARQPGACDDRRRW